MMGVEDLKYNKPNSRDFRKYLRDRIFTFENDVLTITCDRCKRYKENVKYKLHKDGAITFSFLCQNCHWIFHIYRNRLEDYDKVKKVLHT